MFCFESDGGGINFIKMKLMDWVWNYRFLNAISSHQEFIGLNYYRNWKFGKGGSLKDIDITDMGWGIYPKGIYDVLMGLKRYKKDIFITENGLADAEDSKRAAFIRDHLGFIKKAIDDGVNVKGYFYWSLLDNYEWAFGFEKRFGLVAVDYNTFERTIRPSALVYKGIIQKNGL
jgi:beta-glucosidase